MVVSVKHSVFWISFLSWITELCCLERFWFILGAMNVHPKSKNLMVESSLIFLNCLSILVVVGVLKSASNKAALITAHGQIPGQSLFIMLSLYISRWCSCSVIKAMTDRYIYIFVYHVKHEDNATWISKFRSRNLGIKQLGTVCHFNCQYTVYSYMIEENKRAV